MLKNVKVYENGGRAATTTFVQRGIGDVLVTFENEANLAATDFGAGQVDIVYPKYSIKSESPVAVVKAVTDKKGTTDAAKAYLDYLWSEPAQQLAADLYLRPSVQSVLRKTVTNYHQLKLSVRMTPLGHGMTSWVLTSVMAACSINWLSMHRSSN